MVGNSKVRWIVALLILSALLLSACQPIQRPAESSAAAPAAATTEVPAVVSGSVAADWTPPPLSSNVSVFVEGLEYPRGLTFDADGNLYVAEAGRAGDTVVETDTCPTVHSSFLPYNMGDTSRVSRIAPDGTRTTVMDAIPSSRDPYDWTYGATNVALMGDSVYTLIQSGGCTRRLDDVPNGLLSGPGDGSWAPFANLSAALLPDWSVKVNSDDDLEVDGYANSVVAVDDKFYIIETNHGDLFEVGSDGAVTKLVDITEMFGAIAPSVVRYYDGSLYFSNMNAFPTVKDAAKIWKVSMDGKSVEEFAGDLTNVISLAFDGDGNLYVLQMSNGETEIPALGTGRILRINTDGSRDVMATGLSMPDGMALGPDGMLYVSQYSYDMEAGRAHEGQGQIVRVDVSQPVE